MKVKRQDEGFKTRIKKQDLDVKTWLDLTEEELKIISDVCNCMYGRKNTIGDG
ncbi:hypothetical protein [Thermoanaerobacter pentosaceus]|uniref:Uncharacterized protein n=1 Tax=Thermoanaerobacter pentosaceus TaxID=694059 RepID=A0ABT9M143_9THEO|nr:hypothetical protein [Thermoanaerobacter pentosaceus]MDP9749838.1 hypothetical protein [Thermoanaerobacter pentosaceus]